MKCSPMIDDQKDGQRNLVHSLVILRVRNPENTKYLQHKHVTVDNLSKLKIKITVLAQLKSRHLQ